MHDNSCENGTKVLQELDSQNVSAFVQVQVVCDEDKQCKDAGFGIGYRFFMNSVEGGIEMLPNDFESIWERVLFRVTDVKADFVRDFTTMEDFNALIGSDTVFANFSNFGVVIAKYAVPCSTLTRLAENEEVLAGRQPKYPPGSGVTFVDVDCGQHAAVCQQYGANAYPKILLFVEGKQQEHQGSREAKDLVTWVSERHPFVKAE
eukprot:CAMPEP_0175864632 /NCGR_PEP_ID=MMETSP0107_2-20121207/33204_1 /TAXON_ID=195067 ORGANISM="Goniomonas pacifica, Strain CCMP1869" /NCGR_SAMPLE_ID=MMETSP0107_2 /ASSEMBLY_ACC=CAM_ASM_000203 /LENGTH=204 /DNA_ID=CAMNT_0017181955 /DNA_START=129 /DNA_END=745 /DNA_ORIENTATION=+